MSTFLGIDKLQLTTPDFRVKSLTSPIFSVDTGTKQGRRPDEVPYLLTDDTGNQVKAWKAWHNGDLTGAAYTVSDKGLLVSFNPCKMNHPYQLTGLADAGYLRSLKAIESEMKEIGILANLSDMKLCRVDLARQVQMIHPLQQYQSAFRLLKLSRAKGREYDGGYLFANKSNQTIFYDKIKEMEYNKLAGLMAGETNLLRGETRQLNTDAVASVFKLNRLNEFNQLAPDDLANTYKSFLNKRIFSRQYLPDQLQIDFNSEVGIMEQYKQSRGGWLHYLTDMGLDITLMKFGSIDNFASLCADAGYSRMTTHRIKGRLQDMLSRKAYYDNHRGEVTTASLLYELQDKFAA